MYAANYYPRWYYPYSVSQELEDPSHISWDSSGNFIYVRARNLDKTKTVQPLVHIANSFTGPIRNKTAYLNCKFRMPRAEAGKIIGIQVEIQMDRFGKIQDDTVQLFFNGQRIGNNLANPNVDPRKAYSGNWGLTWTEQEFFINGSSLDFGISLRFQSHTTTPHSSTPMIDFVRMRYVVENESPINKQQNRPNIGWTMHLVQDRLWKREPGEQPELVEGTTGGQGGSGTISDGSGEEPGDNNPGFVGSNNFTGSFGFVGSFGSFQGSQAGFIGSSFSSITNITVINSISNLPINGAFRFQGFYILSTQQVFYWDNMWILASSP